MTKTLYVNIFGAPGAGKCLGKGTKILMYSGKTENVENIKVNDLVMCDDSTPRKVLSVHRGTRNLYSVTPNKGDAYVVNKDHILALLSGILDTDGYLGNNCYQIITKYDGLCSDILFLARSLGLIVYHELQGDEAAMHTIAAFIAIKLSGRVTD